MSCWMEGCKLTANHGHPVVDRACSQCVDFGRRNPHVVGQELPPPGPWHCATCNRHEDVWQRTDACWACYTAAHPESPEDEDDYEELDWVAAATAVIDPPAPPIVAELAQEPVVEAPKPAESPAKPKVRAPSPTRRTPRVTRALRATKRAK